MSSYNIKLLCIYFPKNGHYDVATASHFSQRINTVDTCLELLRLLHKPYCMHMYDFE